MPRNVMDFLIQTSRRLATEIYTNISGAACWKERKYETGDKIILHNEKDRTANGQDEKETATPITRCRHTVYTQVADRAYEKADAEPDWSRRLCMTDHAGDIRDEIFHSEEEDDEDIFQSEEEDEEESHELMQEPPTQPSPLPFYETPVESLYNVRPEKRPQQQRQPRKSMSLVREASHNGGRPARKTYTDKDHSGRMRAVSYTHLTLPTKRIV